MKSKKESALSLLEEHKDEIMTLYLLKGFLREDLIQKYHVLPSTLNTFLRENRIYKTVPKKALK